MSQLLQALSLNCSEIVVLMLGKWLQVIITWIGIPKLTKITWRVF